MERINKIILTPGHGGGDPGAVSDNKTEAVNVVKIAKYIQEYENQLPIINADVEILDIDNKLGLAATIAEANRRYKEYSLNSNNNVLLIELHQDQNAPQLQDEQEQKQMGIYYFQNDRQSLELADELAKKFISYGAYNINDGTLENFAGTWRRGHYLEWQGYYLGFINQTNCWSIIIESGYISAPNTDEDLKRFAFWIYKALWEIKAGRAYPAAQIPDVGTNNPNINLDIQKNMFHIQNEFQLTDWVQKWGVARIKESTGKDYTAIEARMNQLEAEVAKPKFHLQSEEDLNDWIKKWGVARLNELGIPLYTASELENTVQNRVKEETAAIIKEKEALENKIKQLGNETWSWSKFTVSLSKSGVYQTALTLLGQLSVFLVSINLSPSFTSQLVSLLPVQIGAVLMAASPVIFALIRQLAKAFEDKKISDEEVGEIISSLITNLNNINNTKTTDDTTKTSNTKTSYNS
jgi:N-acetylmuramoyl-L-alanine amidase